MLPTTRWSLIMVSVHIGSGHKSELGDGSSYSAIEVALDSVVKIFTVSSGPNYFLHGRTSLSRIDGLTLMAIQIDAAINPAIVVPSNHGQKVVGVAFQNLSGAENIGYIIPVPVIKHFITGVEESGKYVDSALWVGKVTGPINQTYLGWLGKVSFRNRERITFDHLVSMKKPNETALIRVLRSGEEQEFSIILRPLDPLVPVHQFDKLPSYYIFAGLVFIPLTQPYLHEYGEDWYNTCPRRLCERALRELPKKAGEQLVILSQVKKINGVEIENLKHLCQLVEKNKEENVRFDLDDERVVILNYEVAKIATSKILKRHGYHLPCPVI
uniref:Protease Do-like PDZ domain-containing protein n=1 Tax=Cannabis sativa TaxID=3483 RepID=A0A803QMT0_CANSA